MKNFFINSLIFFISLLLFLAIGEGVLRVLKPTPVQVGNPDPYLKYGPVPFQDDSDAVGWRNEKVLDRADIVAIGDSMTLGLGTPDMNDAWPQVVGRLASSSVYQMSRGGYGAVQYSHLAKLSLALEPKIAIIDFTFGNDLYDAYDIAYHMDAWKELRDPAYSVPEQPLTDATVRASILAGAPVGSFSYHLFNLRQWFRYNIRLYAMLGDASREWRERLNLVDTADEKLAKVADLGKMDPNIAYVYDTKPEIKSILSPIYRLEAIDLGNSRTKEGWRITQDRFLEMKKLYGDSTTLVIVEFPTKEAVYLELMMRSEGKIPPQFEEYFAKENELHEAFMRFCADNQIRCFSLRKSLVAELMKGRPVYKVVMDGHPPKEGYNAIGEIIYRYLRDEGLLGY